MNRRPILAVLYEHGAVSPAEIVAGLAELGSLVFVLPPTDSAHVRQVRPLLSSLGEVVDRSGDEIGDAAGLRALAPDAVLTFSESQVLATASLAARLGLPGQDIDTAHLLTNKHLQRLRLRESGVDNVRFATMRSLDDWPSALEAVGLPAVIKPVRGEGSRHTFAVNTVAEAEQLLPGAFSCSAPGSDNGPVLVAEELLSGRKLGDFGDYVSVESLCDGDSIQHLALTGKFSLVHPFRESGHFWPSSLSAAEEAEAITLTTAALRALGATTGLTHTEIKLTPDGPRIIEVNGRLGGRINHLARNACGVDLVRIAGLVALGQRVRPSALRPARVHFATWGLAPTEPCDVVAMGGGDEVRILPGITGYRPYFRAGDHLPGGMNTRAMDLLWGHCANHDELSTILGRALTILRYDLSSDSGVRTLSAADSRKGPRPR
ncbi:ATP-grasp domain-containing protein [Streptomyces olivaceus]|uniref:ATP-grasp domain-containing protein n=1 Tax=Streptomyces olivaceus TaxID=47716 RepID=UPI0018851CCA|nr:ATP-grasp domain-containing protein [Streptomyces olivaceus]